MLENIINTLTPLSWQDRLIALQSHYTDLNKSFSTSLSFEDQAITHVIAMHNLPIKIFTLDTGRLFEETHKTAQATRNTYKNITIETYYPDAFSAQTLVRDQGINGFFENVEKRKKCCFTRKVAPLNRALQGVDIWISGLRRDHSASRGTLPIAEMDEERSIIKFYPLIDIEEADIKAYINAHEIPYNELHDKGYPSIGCAPCTRAVADGEHPRAGRWWWEQDNSQECGLHMVDGKLTRIKKG